MTDKQIIIDVTQCPYYKEDKTCTYLPYKTKCEGDCNWTAYKEMEEKLKRKEQECEELKKETVNLKLNLKKVINLSQKKNRQCYQFLADIKQLKHQHQADKGLITSTGKMNYQLLQEYDKLKAVLTEIKELCQKHIKAEKIVMANDILQKISECEV